MPTEGYFNVFSMLASCGIGANPVGKPKRNKSKAKASKKSRRKNRR